MAHRALSVWLKAHSLLRWPYKPSFRNPADFTCYTYRTPDSNCGCIRDWQVEDHPRQKIKLLSAVFKHKWLRLTV